MSFSKASISGEGVLAKPTISFIFERVNIPEQRPEGLMGLPVWPPSLTVLLLVVDYHYRDDEIDKVSLLLSPDEYCSFNIVHLVTVLAIQTQYLRKTRFYSCSRGVV